MKHELFTVKPSLTQHYGRTVTKDMEFEECTDDGEVRQTLKGCVLTTEINRIWKQGEIKNHLHSVQQELLPEGTVIIWNEQMGYIVPNVPVCTLAELEEDIRIIKDAYGMDANGTPAG